MLGLQHACAADIKKLAWLAQAKTGCLAHYMHYYLLTTPKRITNNNPTLPLISKNVCCFFGVLKQ